MSELMSIIKGRRSIRRYQDKQVSDEHLHQVLEAVQWSPSWANSQCWELVVVKDQAGKEKLREVLSATNPASKAMAEAPIIIALCGKLQSSGFYKGEATTKFGDWFMFDLGIATQSLCLMAHHLGLGTVIVGYLDHDRAKKALGLGDGYEVVALIPLGYPAKEGTAPKRRDIKDFVHYEKF
jgi:nitroreductase